MDTIKIKYDVRMVDLGKTHLQLKFNAVYTFQKGLDEVEDLMSLIVPLNPFSSVDKYQQACHYIHERGDEMKKELRKRVKQEVLKALSPERVSKVVYEATLADFTDGIEEIQI